MNFSLTKTVTGAARDWLRQMVKKHQPSNETCAGTRGQGGWALCASPALSQGQSAGKPGV
ncbi:hypothetical protein [Acidovorax soli]|uniref:hypothetical protein n=1 Tax=Acidovorax soli TaxID=592050 RepID=UPI001C88D53E|nr:hypothetical protein [Acidovorax soli]